MATLPPCNIPCSIRKSISELYWQPNYIMKQNVFFITLISVHIMKMLLMVINVHYLDLEKKIQPWHLTV